MKQKKQDRRLHFIAQALNQKLTTNADMANSFYINHRCDKFGTTEALRRFKEWLP